MDALKQNFKPLLKLAIPLIITGMIQSGVFFFETLFLAKIGPKEMAAGAIVSWLFSTFDAILFGLLSAINILVAHEFGAKHFKNISLIIRDGILLSLLLVLPSFLFFWNMSKAFSIFGIESDIALLADVYLKAMCYGLLPNFLLIAVLEAIIGLGYTAIIMKYSLVWLGLNIFFMYVLILGQWGFPYMGVAGAGWAMVISNWISLFVLIIYLLITPYYHRYFTYIFSPIKPRYIKELFKVGLPIGWMYGIELGFFFVVTLAFAAISSVVVAASQIVFQFMGVLLSLVFSLAQAITVRMGHLLGERQLKNAMYAGLSGIILSACIMLVICLVYIAFPHFLIGIDIDIHNVNNQKLVMTATHFFYFAALFQILEAFRMALFGALRALKDTHFTLIISIFSFWCIALPLGYLLEHFIGGQGDGYWVAMIIGASISLIILFKRFFNRLSAYRSSNLGY